ncbi:MAG TPA: heme exporter protein CcmB, partial [Catalimonadaceae bacterium]|nr:heme exporter protein CcmB [Catalimonadaceae bacterium]
WGFLSVFFKNPVQDSLLFVIAIQLCCIGLSAGLTLVSAIAAKAESNAALLPVLGFPLVIPTLLFVLRISVTAVDGLDWEMAWKNIWTLLGIDSIMIALSILLFPYLWRQ